MATNKMPVLLILVVVLTIAVAASLYIPAGGIRPNDSCIANLRVIDGAEQQWAIYKKKTTNDTPSWDDIRYYLGLRREAQEVLPQCPQGGK